MPDYLNDQPYDEALRERALAVLSAMALWMKEHKQDMGIFQEVFPVNDEGTIQEYHVSIVVRKKKELPKNTGVTEVLRGLGYNV